MEEDNEWISLTVKISFSRESERSVKTNWDDFIILYKEFEGNLKVIFIKYFRFKDSENLVNQVIVI